MKIEELLSGIEFESNKYEFKKNLNSKEKKKWLKTICGFANAGGGHMLIGVSDNGDLFPFVRSEVDQLKQLINNSIKSNISPLPKYDINVIKLNNKYIVDINVFHNTSSIVFFTDPANGNQIYVRRDGQTTFATQEEIILLIKNANLYEFDKTEVGIKADDVQFEELNEEYKKANNNETLTKKILIGMGLISPNQYLTIAGLLFCDNTVYQNANLTCTIWPGETKGAMRYLDTKTYKDNILKLMYFAIDYIHNVPFYLFGGQKSSERRIDIGSFSDLSLREAIVNAIAHRDYTIDSNEISIDCFKDRIEINSPGSMLHGTTYEYKRIDENIVSHRRNQTICTVFEKCKLMENKGSGFVKIIEDYKGLGDSYVPIFKATTVSFTIILRNKKVLATNQNITTPITASKYYLNNRILFRGQDELFTDNPNLQTIVNLIKTDQSTDYAKISQSLNITKDGAKYLVNRLRKAGMIKRVGSNRAGHYEIISEINRPSDFLNLDNEIQNRVITWCKKYFYPSKAPYINASSYGLKHIFEEDTGIYLTNGQFKGAMILSGFSVDKIDELNWHFNISKDSPALNMDKKA